MSSEVRARDAFAYGDAYDDALSRGGALRPHTPTVGPPSHAARRPRARWKRTLVFTLLTVASSLLLANRVVHNFASSLYMASAGGDPAWIVEVTSASERPGLMLVTGNDVKTRLYRVPSRSAGPREPRALPFGGTHGVVHLRSLGWSPLRVRMTDRRDATDATDAAARPRTPGSASPPVQEATGRAVTGYEPAIHPGRLIVRK